MIDLLILMKEISLPFLASSAGSQDSSVGKKTDLQSIDCSFESHCRRGVFLVWAPHAVLDACFFTSYGLTQRTLCGSASTLQVLTTMD